MAIKQDSREEVRESSFASLAFCFGPYLDDPPFAASAFFFLKQFAAI